MLPIPADIFTEPGKLDPDGIGNLGPLLGLAGTWQATKGVDINPKPNGPERRTFIERIRMDPIDPQTNGPQVFYGLRYHIHINTLEEAITFHDQVGYWLWEPNSGLILQTVAIPRGQVLLASGAGQPGDTSITVAAKHGDVRYGICSNDFLEEAFRTDSYRCTVTFHADGSWSYDISTQLTMKGEPGQFDHHDTNTLTRIAQPVPNPLLAVLNGRKG